MVGVDFGILEDRRIPAADVRGILADYQIRRQELDEISREIERNWLGVCEVCAGQYNNKPYFVIHLEPFSRELQAEHWALGDVINNIIRSEDFSFFYLPKMEHSPYSSEIVIFKRG